MGPLSGRTALVTGSNGGLGSAIVERLAADGASVFAHARRPSDDFAAMLEALSVRHHVVVSGVYFDLTDYEAMKASVRPILQESGVDILVNNAGVAHGGLVQMTPVDAVRAVFEVNFFAQVALTQLVLRTMTRAGAGSIINVASIAGLDVRRGNIAYGTSKAALIAMTKTTAAEVAALGVRVNAVAPGLVHTPMAALMEERAGAEMVAASAMKRLADPSEVASVVSFLASDAAAFVNGQVLRIDGGST